MTDLRNFDGMLDDIKTRIDISKPLREICDLLGLPEGRLIRRLDITSVEATAEVYTTSDGKVQTSENGYIAVELRYFKVST